MKESELRTALLISGRGSTAKAVIEACRDGELQRITPIAVICSRPDIPGKAMAERLGIKTFVCERRNFPSREKFGEALLKILKSLNVDLVSQNGWLPTTPLNVIEEYKNMIVNQHPGPLDPGTGNDFGGQGMYGSRVTCAVILYSWLTQTNFFTEATTHFVLPEVDEGDLIRVVKIDLPFSHKPVTIAEILQNQPLKLLLTAVTQEVKDLLLPIEHKNVIETLRLFAEGKVFGTDGNSFSRNT